MGGEDIISKRGNALENQFFASVDEKLLAALKEQLTKAEHTKELARLSGIQSESVASALVSAGVAPTTFPALRIFPLVAVAWADGLLTAAERETVLAAADKYGIDRNSPSGEVLASWLATEPPESLFVAWESFAKELASQLPVTESKALRESLVSELHQVAKASGGILGWASISQGEHQVMNRVAAALS